MVLKLVILFASVAYTPGLAQTNTAAASANAYGVATAGGATASAFSYAQSSNGYGYNNCKRDYNATYSDCRVSHPSTCANPNGRNYNNKCVPGYECNYGYLLSSRYGKCIKPEDCPGGKVCRQNETFVGCLVECPDLYCPVNEYRVACGVARPCPSACACKSGYLRRNVYDHTCIKSTDCPPGKCSRANEEWNQCVPVCFSDSCKYRKILRPDCPFSPLECYPGCLCKEKFYRNERNECVPVQECPKI